MLLSDHTNVLRSWTLAAFEGSSEYVLDESRLDDLFLLTDRVFSACRNHPDVGRVDAALGSLAAIIGQAAQGDVSDAENGSVIWLQHHMEHWLKAIWWLSKRSSYEAAKNEDSDRYREGKTRRFNLFAALIALDLLEVAEANLRTDQSDEIQDPIRRLVFKAKELRNAGHDLEQRVKVDPGPTLMAVICAPIIKHRASLSAILRGLIVRPLELSPVRLQTLHSVSESRRSHVERFAGRHEWLQSLRLRAEHIAERGGYLLLIGPEGQGKTALCSMLSESLRERDVLDSNGPKVLREAPWMPGVLFHLGKQSRRVAEIIELLVAQANVLLLRPIPLLVKRDEPTLYGELPTPAPHEPPKGLEELSRTPERNSGVLKAQVTSDGARSLDDYRSRLFWVLSCLQEERAGGFVIIDGLDEICRRGEDLAFLPTPIPKGCVVLLTVRSHLGLDEWLSTNLHNVEVVALGNLPRNQIPMFTNVADDAPSGGRDFNDQVYRKTGGWAYMVSAVSDELRANGGDWRRVRLDGLVETVLESQAHRWVQDGDALRLLLPMLALFEQSNPIPIDALQSFLFYAHTVRIPRFEVVDQLRRVGSQLEGVLAGKVKLAQSVFGHYVRERFLSRRDYEDALANVLAWMIADDELDPAIVAQFLLVVPPDVERRRPDGLTTSLIEGLRTKKAARRLRAIGRSAAETAEGSLLADQCWRTAAEMGDRAAAFSLARRLLKVSGEGARNPEAERLLIEAAEAGDARSMGLLGDYLIRLPEEDSKRTGIQWLTKAAEKTDRASMVLLGAALVQGKWIPQDKAAGEVWLRRAVDQDAVAAFKVLAMLIDGKELAAREPNEARELWRKAADRGDVRAMYEYGHACLSDASQPSMLDEGERVLRQAASRDSLLAIRELGLQMLRRRIGSPEEGREWLLKGIEKNDVRSKAILGGEIVAGTVPNMDVASGLSLLEASAGAGDTLAMRLLSAHLLDRETAADSQDRGLSWLRRAVEAKDARAKVILAERLLDGRSLPRNEREGRRLLEEAAPSSVSARAELGRRLLRGEGLPADVATGREILEGLIKEKRVEGLHELGAYYIDSSEPSLQIQAREWLDSAISQGYAPSMAALGNHLVSQPLPVDSHTILAGRALLQHAFDLDLSAAAMVLGYHFYRRGAFADSASWFRKAYDLRLPSAANNLAYIVRRREIDGETVGIPMHELLESAVAGGDPFGLINRALAICTGFDGPVDWPAAERCIAAITPERRNFSEALEWWRMLADAGEAEGHVVLGWISQCELAPDPSGWTSAARFTAARTAGWTLPEAY